MRDDPALTAPAPCRALAEDQSPRAVVALAVLLDQSMGRKSAAPQMQAAAVAAAPGLEEKQ